MRVVMWLIGWLVLPAVLATGQVGAPAPPPATPPPAMPPPMPPPAPPDSPRSAVVRFVEAMEAVETGRGGENRMWEQALSTLDVSHTPPPPPEVAARHLAAVLSRLGVEPLTVPDEVDAADMKLRRWTFFPRDKHAAIWEQLEKYGRWPQGSVVLERGADGGWRFSASTVSGADLLSHSLEPLPPVRIAAEDERDRPAVSRLASLLGPTFERTPPWAWITLLAAILLGVLLGKAAASLLRRSAAKWRSLRWPAWGEALDDAAGPAQLAVVTLFLWLGLTSLHLRDEMVLFSHTVVRLLAIVAVAWLTFNLVDVAVLPLRRRAHRSGNKLDDVVVPLVAKSLRIFLIVVFSLAVAQNVFGLDITGWLAGLGIAGLAVSLAAQDSIKNLFGSLTVFIDKPFAVGDMVTWGGYTGTVEQVGFRSTKVRLLNGHLATIPNMKWIDSDVENVAARPSIRRNMNITITYDTPRDKVAEAVRRVRDVLTDPAVVASGRFDMEETPPRVAFNEFNADSLNIRAIYWYRFDNDPDRTYFTYLDHCELVNMKLFESFDEAGIDFAFPTQTLYLANDERRQLAVRGLGMGGDHSGGGGGGGGGDALSGLRGDGGQMREWVE